MTLLINKLNFTQRVFLSLFFMLEMTRCCYADSFCTNNSITITNQGFSDATILRTAPYRPTKLFLLMQGQTIAPGATVSGIATPLPTSGFGRALGSIFIIKNNTYLRFFYSFTQDFATSNCTAQGKTTFLAAPANVTATITAKNGVPGKINLTLKDVVATSSS